MTLNIFVFGNARTDTEVQTERQTNGTKRKWVIPQGSVRLTAAGTRKRESHYVVVSGTRRRTRHLSTVHVTTATVRWVHSNGHDNKAKDRPGWSVGRSAKDKGCFRRFFFPFKACSNKKKNNTHTYIYNKSARFVPLRVGKGRTNSSNSASPSVREGS